MADDKIQGIRDIPPPRNLAELRHFIGILGFYDRFIPHYSDHIASLTDLTKKDTPWEWTTDRQRAFDLLIAGIRNDIFLRAFDPEKPIRLSTDASDVAYAGILEQEYEDGWHPFLMFHHKFKDGEKGWDGPDKELYAIVYAFSHYRHFLSQPKHQVQVFTDHRNLSKFMFSSNLLKSHDGRLGRWWEVLSQSNFQIQYLPGRENLLPDFLSRHGFEASAELEPRILLPEKRFSPKTLSAIQDWFKKSEVTPNIRQRLEQKFQNQNSSPDPVPARQRISPASFNARQLKLANSLNLCRYYGAALDPLIQTNHNNRSGRDRSGLGYNQYGMLENKPPISWTHMVSS